jgi:predicted deacylase
MAQRTDLWDSRPGTRTYRALPVTTDLGGHQIALPVHLIRGRRGGPTLTLIAAVHGNEWMSTEVVRRVLDRIDPAHLAGNVLAVPVANPVAYTFGRRQTPDDTLSPDLHRSFGMPGSSISEQLARGIAQEIFARSDFVLDYHTLCWGVAFAAVFFRNDDPDAGLNKRTDELARLFGCPMLAGGSRDPSCTSGYAGVMGIPAITIELGGAGFGSAVEEPWLEANVQGAMNVLYHHQMLAGEVQWPERYFYWGKRWRVHPTRGGLLQPRKSPDQLISVVEAGEELGAVLDPLTLDVVEVLRAPAKGLLYSIARSYPVRPGDWAFGVVDLETLRAVPGGLA